MSRFPFGGLLRRRWAVAAFALAPLVLSTLALTGCSEERGGVTAPDPALEEGSSDPNP